MLCFNNAFFWCNVKECTQFYQLFISDACGNTFVNGFHVDFAALLTVSIKPKASFKLLPEAKIPWCAQTTMRQVSIFLAVAKPISSFRRPSKVKRQRHRGRLRYIQ